MPAPWGRQRAGGRGCEILENMLKFHSVRKIWFRSVIGASASMWPEGPRRMVQAVGSPPPYRAHSGPAWRLAVMSQDEGEHCSPFCRGDRSLCSLSVKSWLKAQGEACQGPLLGFHRAWKGGVSALQPAYCYKTKFRTNPPSSMTDTTLLWTCWRAEPTTDTFPRLFGILKGSYLKRNGVKYEWSQLYRK